MRNFPERPDIGYSNAEEEQSGGTNSGNTIFQKVQNLLEKSGEHGLTINIHGEKGSGKTYLLKRLQNAHQDATHLAYCDLSMGNLSKVFMTEPVSALLYLRSNLSRNYFFCPLFDLLIASYFYQKGVLNRVNLRDFYAAKDRLYLIKLWEIFENPRWQSINQDIYNLIKKTLKANFPDYEHHTGLSLEKIDACLQFDSDTAIAKKLPDILASELNASIRMPTTPQKLILIFDNFPTNDDNPVNTSGVLVKKWLSLFIRMLEILHGIHLVFSSREKIDFDTSIPDLKIPSQPHLFLLTKTGYEQKQSFFINWKKLFPEHEHIFSHLSNQNVLNPYRFGVCKDILSAKLINEETIAIEDFSHVSSRFKKSSFYTRKLLQINGREYAYSLIALSAARYFDWPMYQYLAHNLNFEATQPTFYKITELSFTQQYNVHGKLYYRFYDEAIEDIQTYSKKVLVESHSILERYFSQKFEKGDKFALCDAIYHRCHVNKEKGIVRLLKAFESALAAKDILLLNGLLDIISRIQIDSEFWLGQALQNIAMYFHLTGQNEEALLYLQKAQNSLHSYTNKLPEDLEGLNSKGVAIFSRGEVLQKNHGFSHSTSSYAEAMIYFSEILKKNPGFVSAQINSVLITIKQAFGYPLNDQSQERILRFEMANEQLENILKMSPGCIPALQIYAQLQLNLAREYHNEGNDDKVLACLNNGCEVFGHKKGNQHDKRLMQTRAVILKDAAHIEISYGYYYDADEHFQAAVEIARTLLENEENTESVLASVEILISYASFQLKYMQLTGATNTLEEAENYVLNQLWAYPKSIHVNNVLGYIALSKAKIFLNGYDFEKAQTVSRQAEDYFSNVLWFDNMNHRARVGKALAAGLSASINAQFSNFPRAISEFKEALELFRSLPIESLSVGNFHNLVSLSLDYAEMLFESGQYEMANQRFTRCNALLQENRNTFPNTFALQIAQAKIDLGLSKNYVISARYIDASESMGKAIAQLNAVMQRTSENLTAILVLAQIYMNYTQLENDIGHTGKAIDWIAKAINLFEEAIGSGITIPDILNGKAQSQCILAKIQMANGYYDQAESNLQQSLSLYDEVLGVTETNTSANIGKSDVYLQIANLHFHLAAYDNGLTYCHYACEQLLDKAPLRNNLHCIIQLSEIFKVEARIHLARIKFQDAETVLHKMIQHTEAARKVAASHVEPSLLKVDFLLLQAEIYEKRGEIDKAIKNSNNALQILDKLAHNYKDSVAISNNTGLAHTQLAKYMIAKGEFDRPALALEKAVGCFDGVLKFAPENHVLNNNKANSFQILATVKASNKNNETVAEILQQADSLYDTINKHNTNDLIALYNRGLTQAKAAYIHTSLNNVKPALAAFKKAIYCFERTLEIAPHSVDFHQKKGDAYLGSGILLISANKTEEAIECLQVAIEAFDKALQLRENNGHSLYSKGRALLHLGELQNKVDEKGQALWSYQHARECFTQLLEFDSSQVQVTKNLADVNMALGELQVNFSQHSDALAQYLNAVNLYESVLKIRPGNNQVLFNQAFANERIGFIHELRLERAQAIKYYNTAKRQYHQLCQLNSSLVQAYFELGKVLVELGKIYIENKDEHEAKLCFHEAIKSYSHQHNNFHLEPPVAHRRGRAHILLADFFSHQGYFEEAVKEYRKAFESCKSAGENDAIHAEIFYDKGIAAERLAATYKEISQPDQSIAYYTKAIEAYDIALQIDANMIDAHFSKAVALTALYELHQLEKRVEKAKFYLKSALDQLTHAKVVDPSHHAVFELFQRVESEIAQLDPVVPGN